jgi:hypothetical protein
MAGLTTPQIDRAVDLVVPSNPSPIAGMAKETWAYLLKFTCFHEGVVNFLYSNKGKPGVTRSDVTIGIGISLPTKVSCGAYVGRFFVKGTNFSSVATLEQIEADWVTVDGMSRATNTLDDFGRAVQTEIRPEDAIRFTIAFYGKYVPGRLNSTDFADFADWPAQAQVALASYCYGLSPEGAPKMRAALRKRDFDTAGLQSWISTWEDRKLIDHRVLFWNAARITEQRAKNPGTNKDSLPDGFEFRVSMIPLTDWPAGTPQPRLPDAVGP